MSTLGLQETRGGWPDAIADNAAEFRSAGG